MEDEIYTAEEAARRLQTEGFADFSKRSVYYYAFEKNMFPVSRSGKGCFTAAELDKLRAIKLLQEHTRYTLEQIRDIIASHSLDEIKELCRRRTARLNPAGTALADAAFAVTSVPAEAGADSCLLDAPARSGPAPSVAADETRAVKVNADITLVVSSRVTTAALARLIELIRNSSV